MERFTLAFLSLPYIQDDEVELLLLTEEEEAGHCTVDMFTRSICHACMDSHCVHKKPNVLSVL